MIKVILGSVLVSTRDKPLNRISRHEAYGILNQIPKKELRFLARCCRVQRSRNGQQDRISLISNLLDGSHRINVNIILSPA